MKWIQGIILISITMYSQASLTNSDLEYYPSDTGNYFEYKSYSWQLPYPPDSSAHSITILGDTTLSNGKEYKILFNSGIPTSENGYYIYERIDTSTGSVFRYDENEDFNGNEYKIDSLFAQEGDTIRCSRRESIANEDFFTICLSVQQDTILGIETEIKEFDDLSGIPAIGYTLVKGFGFYHSFACEFGCGSTTLVYAEIDGISYGKKITSVKREKDGIPKLYKLSQNYPTRLIQLQK